MTTDLATAVEPPVARNGCVSDRCRWRLCIACSRFASAGHFRGSALVRIEAVSGGNPLYALELTRALRSADFPPDPHATLPVPDSLSSLVTGRIAALQVETRRALVLVAAAVDPTLETLTRARAGPGGIPRACGRRGDRSSVSPPRPSGSATPCSHNPFSALRRATSCVLVHAPPAGDCDRFTRFSRAHHLGQAADAPDEAVAVELAEAAGRARGRGATLDASALYLEAARATPPSLADRRLERGRLAAECLFIDLSEAVQADAILEAAIAAAPPGPDRADALSLRALVCTTTVACRMRSRSPTRARRSR